MGTSQIHLHWLSPTMLFSYGWRRPNQTYQSLDMPEEEEEEEKEKKIAGTSPRHDLLTWLALGICTIATLVNIVSLNSGTNARVRTVIVSYNDLQKLRRPSPFIGL